MQGNSKYLRWSPLYTCCCIFVILSSTVIAVPVRPRRMVTETYPTFDAINSNTISNVTCLKDGKEVLKSSVECEVKIGCKLIQKTGECCPEYQCNCTHEGVTYKNGERINNNDPCRRCLCKGGEVTCSEISCYIRDDCKPRYMKGVCCPTYDNCPPLDDAKIASSKESDQTINRITTPRNDAIMSLTTVSSAIHKDENTPLLNFANENPLGIKIIEITKPEEIRITDDKPKAFIPKFATTTTTTTAQTPKIEEVTKTQTTESSAIAFNESTTTDSPTTTTTTTTAAPTKIAVDFEDSNQSVNSNEREIHDYMDDGTIVDDKIPGVAAAPPTKSTVTIDGEVEPELLLAGADSNTIGDESSNKNVRQTVENSTSAEIDHSSESSSEFFSSTTENDFDSLNKEVSTTSTENDEVVAMAVTHMPKNIVIVRQGGKTESFHILGTDGLQRVEELDVLSSTTEGGPEDISEVAAPFSEQSTVETVTNQPASHSTTEEPSSSESSSTVGESFEDDHTVAIAVDKKLDNTLQSNESTTENLTNNSIEVSTPSDTVTENISEEVHETIFYAEENDKSTELTVNDEPIDTSFHGPTENDKDGSSTTDSTDYSSSTIDSNGYSTTEQIMIASTTVTESTTTTTTTTTTSRSSSVEPCVELASRSEDEESTLAENPEFPYIPDDLSIHCKQIEEEEKHRLPNKEFHSSTISNNKRESLVGLASSEISTVSPSDDEIKKSHEVDTVEARAPGEPLLIPEWERSTTESPLSMESSASEDNQTNDIQKTSIWDRYSFEISKENRTESESVEKSTSSSEEKYDSKEPTTARATTRKYADVIENEDGVNVSMSSEQLLSSTEDTLSPKDDAESIKFNSEGESSAPIASYEGPSFKFIDLAMKDSWRTWAKENGWPF